MTSSKPRTSGSEIQKRRQKKPGNENWNSRARRHRKGNRCRMWTTWREYAFDRATTRMYCMNIQLAGQGRKYKWVSDKFVLTRMEMRRSWVALMWKNNSSLLCSARLVSAGGLESSSSSGEYTKNEGAEKKKGGRSAKSGKVRDTVHVNRATCVSRKKRLVDAEQSPRDSPKSREIK